MCTVTYLPQSTLKSFILTSNRDEKVLRSTIPPEFYIHNGIRLGFPKDVLAGGSWITISENRRVCCLLNGAFVAHKKESFHTKSRGLILLEIASSKQPVSSLYQSLELSHVEPFTIITIDLTEDKINSFTEFIWTGHEKFLRKLDINEPHIWSSVTLYSEEQRQLRKSWFTNFNEKYGDAFSHDEILSFHSANHTNDTATNVIMEREGGLKTVSITQIISKDSSVKMRYYDLATQIINEIEI